MEETKKELKDSKLEEAKKKRKLFYRAKVKAAERFAAEARLKLGNMIKSIALIGSLAREDFTPGSDIDVLVVIDDTNKEVPEELKKKLHLMLIDIAKRIDKKIQVQMHTITEIFHSAKNGDNIIYNFLRHMKIIYDSGFLKPLKRLLKRGEIKPTKEAMDQALQGSEFYLKKIDEYAEMIMERYYRAVTWATNAYIMSLGENPVAVPEMPLVLKIYADKGLIPSELPKIAAEVIAKYKAIEHGDKKAELKEACELEPKVRAFVDIIKKEVISSLVKDKLDINLKEKIKTFPKLILEGKNARILAWFLDDGIYFAISEKDKKEMIFRKGIVSKGKIETLVPIKEEELFMSIEASEIKPLINKDLLKIVLDAIPSKYKPFKKISIEYPGKAMIDLTEMMK